MIYTITLSPAIDYYITLNQELLVDEVNRGNHEIYKAGGKGLNVSKVLSILGIRSCAIALLGGFTGQFIYDSFQKDKNIQMIPIAVDGMNRINMKAHYHDKALCINGSGPTVTQTAITTLFHEIEKMNPNDIAIISGSMMNGFPNDFIIDLSKKIQQRKAKIVMDMEQITLSQLQQIQPFLIKPNLYEFQMLFGQKSMDDSNIIQYLQYGLQHGIQNILLSLGKDGAIFANQNEIYRLEQPHIPLVNKVGAGDAMLAAFIGKLSQNESIRNALCYGGAAGNATASQLEDIGLCDIQKYLSQMNVRKLASISNKER